MLLCPVGYNGSTSGQTSSFGSIVTVPCRRSSERKGASKKVIVVSEFTNELIHCPKKGSRYRTIKGGSRRAEKSRKVLMMMKAVKLGWAGAMKNSESKMVLVRLW